MRGEAGGLGRFENIRAPITTEQIRQWCGNPDAQVIVKPVVDLADQHHVNAYEVPDRIREQSALIRPTCVFPWCTRSARRCDSDDIAPALQTPPPAQDPRRMALHPHRRGHVLWTSPHGYQFLRDPSGTLDVNRDRRA